MTPTTPRLAFPFQFKPNGHLAAVEQDSVEDVAQCVEIVLRTRPGDRVEHPALGSPDITFSEMPIDTAALLDALGGWEPRARLLIDTDPSALDPMAQRLRIQVGIGQ